MKKQDYIFIGCVIVCLAPFFIFDSVYAMYNTLTAEHGMIMSFFKFAILATVGEMIGLRIQKGVYNEPGFGVLPRMIVWGILGMGISMAMVIFKSGTVSFLEYLGLEDARAWFAGGLSWGKVLVAFCISLLMNSIFAPVFMTLHKITDTHILNNGGTLKGFLRPIKMTEIITNLNWKVQWSFVFKKTIPFFWYPAHTITFLLPQNFQVLFAAFLGVALGVILSISNLKKK